MCIRIPMISEADDLVSVADCSLESEISVLCKVDKAAAAKGRIHEVILMADLGDLREGFWTTEELIEAALITENELKNLELVRNCDQPWLLRLYRSDSGKDERAH